MEIIEAINTRRSIRRFTGEPVSEADLNLVLTAGFQAPSAHNYQPREFVIVQKEETLAKIAQVHPYAKMLPQAGTGIIVCGDKDKQQKLGFLIADCAATIENILLAAHGIGLGAVWCGLHPVNPLAEAIATICGLPANMVPVGMVVLGHKAETKEPVKRYDPEKIHRETW